MISYVCTTISYVNLRYRMSTYDIVGYQESRWRWPGGPRARAQATGATRLGSEMIRALVRTVVRHGPSQVTRGAARSPDSDRDVRHGDVRRCPGRAPGPGHESPWHGHRDRPPAIQVNPALKFTVTPVSLRVLGPPGEPRNRRRPPRSRSSPSPRRGDSESRESESPSR